MEHEIIEVEPIETQERVFELAQRQAKAMITGSILPPQFRTVGDVLILNEMSKSLKIPSIMLAQGLYMVKNKPSMSGQLVIAILNGSKRFDAPIRWEERAKPWGIRAYASINGDKFEGDWIDDALIQANGWISNPHWKNNKQLMAKYRAATWFARLYCPDLLMGMTTEGEVVDSKEVSEEIEVQIMEADTQKDVLKLKRKLSTELKNLDFTNADVTAFAKKFDLAENTELLSEMVTNKEVLMSSVSEFEKDTK